MEINNSQAATAYTTGVNATQAVDSTKLREQNTESVTTDRNTESTNTAQKPFEVDITQEARDMLAAENAEKAAEAPVEEQTPPPEPQTEQAPAAARETSQIVNIVA